MMDRFKISFIAPFGIKAKGTTLARVLPIAEALSEKGYGVRVVVPPWDDPIDSPDLGLKQARSEVVNGVERVFVPVRPGPQPLTIPVRLVQEARAFRPDFIHVFKPKAYSGLAGLLLGLRGIPFALDTDDWEGRGGYNDINPYSRPQKWLFEWQERDLPRRAAAVTVASRTLEAQAWGFGVKPERVYYLPNGVAQHKYAGWSGEAVELAAREQQQKLGLPDEALVLLAYTRFVEFKPERLLEIVRLTLEKLPPEVAERVRLLVAGGGFFGEEKQMHELAARYGLAERLIITGAVKPAELPAMLRCGDVALYPFDDNLINRARCSAKFLDLLMAERVVVTEAVGELREYLREGQGGCLVAPGDTAAFAENVARLIMMSREERTAVGQAGAQHLRTSYSWERLVEPLEELYSKSKLK
jgi:glycosyltransferase involved in cell wall biosynthesis